MYHILCIQILCDHKVESWFIHLLHSVVQMSTVWSWGPTFPSDSNSREVVQLYAAVGAVYSEHSSNHLSELVGKVSLRTFCRDEAETRQCCLFLSECAVLDFQGHRLCEFTWCWDPEDRAKEVWIFRKLKLPRETCSDVDPALSHTRWKTTIGNIKPQSIPPPCKWASLVKNFKLYFSNHLYSANEAWRIWVKVYMH